MKLKYLVDDIIWEEEEVAQKLCRLYNGVDLIYSEEGAHYITLHNKVIVELMFGEVIYYVSEDYEI